jgi:hypothetical protein
MNRGRIAPRVAGSGVAPIDVSQSVQFQAIASTMVPIDVSQAILATFVATKGLVAAQMDVDPSKNVTLSTTMRLTGTSSAMTLAAGSGSLTYASSPPAYLITIEAGATTFSIAYDGAIGTNKVTGIAIPVSSTYTVPGGKPGAGNVFTFGATFNAGDTYECACSSHTTADTNAYVFSQATAASQPVFSQDATGYHFKYAGGQTLECSTAGLIALFTNDPAMTFMMKFAPTTADLSEDMFTITQSASTNGSHRFGKTITGSGRLSHVCVNDAGSSTNSNQTRGVDDLTNGGVTKYCWYGPGSNGGTNCKVNDANLNPTAGTWNPGTVTPTRATRGATHDNAVRRAYTGKEYRVVAFSSQLSASDQTAWNAAL